jgi:DNA (cytosine-5)-methyltransferase 1
MNGPRVLSLFTGTGALDLAVLEVLGGTVVAHAEHEPPTERTPRPRQAAARVLAHRWPGVPNLGDVTRVDWRTLGIAAGPVDVITAGFPCQDVSLAGLRLGIAHDTRSGLWAQVAAAVGELRPALVVIENVRGLLSARAQHPAHGDVEPCAGCVGDGSADSLRAFGAVLGDLADVGYDASWQLLRASDVGAPHERARVFVVAWPRRTAADPVDVGHERGRRPRRRGSRPAHGGAGAVADRDVPRLGRVGRVDPVERHVDRRGRADGPRETSEPPAPVVEWGRYAPAVRRWEAVLGRPAPAPTVDGQLSPRFVEWHMGLPEGWVTDVPGLTRTDMLRVLGNGVVPRQAVAGLRLLLPDVETTAPPSDADGGAA